MWRWDKGQSILASVKLVCTVMEVLMFLSSIWAAERITIIFVWPLISWFRSFTGIYFWTDRIYWCCQVKDANFYCPHVYCSLYLAHWSEIKFKWTMPMSEEVLKGVLLALLFTLTLAENLVLASLRTMMGGGDRFPLRQAIFTFDKITWRCVCYGSFSVGDSTGNWRDIVYRNASASTGRQQADHLAGPVLRGGVSLIHFSFYWCLGSSCLWKE